MQCSSRHECKWGDFQMRRVHRPEGGAGGRIRWARLCVGGILQQSKIGRRVGLPDLVHRLAMLEMGFFVTEVKWQERAESRLKS